jgi:hypothetical protein
MAGKQRRGDGGAPPVKSKERREKTEEDRPPLRWPTSRPPQMGRRSGAGLEVGSLDPPALEPLAPAIDGPALDLPSWGFSPPGPLDSPAQGPEEGTMGCRQRLDLEAHRRTPHRAGEGRRGPADRRFAGAGGRRGEVRHWEGRGHRIQAPV